MVVAMKNKVRFVTIAGMLLIAAILLFLFWIRGRRMENRFRADRELFQTTAEAFCDKYTEMDWPVLVRSGDGRKAVSKEYGFSESVINDIDKILRTTNCYSIYAGDNSASTYCKFSDGRINSRTGLIYISDAEQAVGRDAEGLVESCTALYVQTAYFVDEQWIYFEGIPPHAMD